MELPARQFFDAKMNGVDWNAVRSDVRAAGRGRARRRTRCGAHLRLMIGELNASHLGVSAPRRTRGRAGTTSAGSACASTARSTKRAGRLKVTDVVPLGPAGVAGIKPGDYLAPWTASPLGAHANLDELLDHTIGRRVALSVSGAKEVTSREPVSLATREEPAVPPVGGRTGARTSPRSAAASLGYVHMATCRRRRARRSSTSISTPRTSAREGVVIDIRNNNGGFVNAYAIDVFARRGYLHDDRRAARRGAGAHGARPARARSCRRSWSPTSTRCPTPRISPRVPRAQAREGRRRADGGLDHLHLGRAR